MATVDLISELVTPERALQAFKKAKEFWIKMKDLPLAETIEGAGIDWEEVTRTVESYGLKLPFVYSKEDQKRDSARAVRMEEAMKLLQEFENEIVQTFVLSPTKIAGSLIGGTEMLIANSSSAIVTIIEGLNDPNRDTAASYWKLIVSLFTDALAPILLGAQAAKIKKLFKSRPDPIEKALPQSTGKRTRKKARTRIAHQVRAARR